MPSGEQHIDAAGETGILEAVQTQQCAIGGVEMDFVRPPIAPVTGPPHAHCERIGRGEGKGHVNHGASGQGGKGTFQDNVYADRFRGGGGKCWG
jgi:hypothetical protein